jgi:hypothetical protein
MIDCVFVMFLLCICAVVHHVVCNYIYIFNVFHLNDYVYIYILLFARYQESCIYFQVIHFKIER